MSTALFFNKLKEKLIAALNSLTARLFLTNEANWKKKAYQLLALSYSNNEVDKDIASIQTNIKSLL